MNTRWPVAATSLVIIAGLTIWGLVSPAGANGALTAIVTHIADWFGWFFLILATAVLVFVLTIGVRYRHVRLGPDGSSPEYSTLSWACMLFAAGIGTDILFFSVSEAVTQFLAPPLAEPGSTQAASEAPVWMLVHYGLHGWGMYALMGIALGYAAHRNNKPLAVRSSLEPLLGRRVEGWAGHLIDVATIVATIFGLATSLGIGVVMIATGIEILTGHPADMTMQVALLVLAILVATLSAITGISRGIKILSQLNVGLSVVLCLVVLATGNMSHLGAAMARNLVDTARHLIPMTLGPLVSDYPQAWMIAWTLFFWAWWIAWASFVGLFLARISKGRTIGQFVLGALTIPLAYVALWALVFGNRAIDMILAGDTEFAELTMADPARGIFTLLESHPMPMALIAIACLTGLLFYVTSADSGALVMANLSSKLPDPTTDAHPAMRIVWALATGALTLAMLLVGGIPALQNATIIMGLPFGIVMILVMIALARSLRAERRGHLR